MAKDMDSALDEALDLVDMKRTKKEIKAEKAEYSGSPEAPAETYPWGLEIRLETESLKKLGLDELPKVGDEMMVSAVAVVESVREEEQMKNGGTAEPRRTVELQIQKLGLSKGKS